jgi:hypothetical protein
MSTAHLLAGKGLSSKMSAMKRKNPAIEPVPRPELFIETIVSISRTPVFTYAVIAPRIRKIDIIPVATSHEKPALRSFPDFWNRSIPATAIELISMKTK